MIVLDASVLLKWFLDESDSSQALSYQQRHVPGKDSIAIPDLAFYEIANAFILRSQLSPEEIQKNLLQLQDYQFQVALFSELIGVVGIARKHGLTTYDAAYVALAQKLRCRFVTADERLLARLKGVPNVSSLREASR